MLVTAVAILTVLFLIYKKKNKQKLQRFTGRPRTEDINMPKPNLPQSPESICMKALKSEFFEQL